MITDYLKIILLSIAHRKLRAWLTVLGILIGITAIVSLISIGQGAKEAMNEQFEMMGTNKLIVMPKAFFSGTTVLTERDLEEIRKVKGVSEAAGIVFKTVPVKYGSKLKYTYLTGLPTDKSMKVIEEMQNMKVTQGRFLEKRDEKKAVVAYSLHSRKYFGKNIKVGDKLTINNQEFEVVGLLDSFGNQEDDNNIFVPMEDARAIFNDEEGLNIIYVEISEGVNQKEVANRIERSLRKLHDVEEGSEDFDVQTSDELLRTVNSILMVMQVVFVGIASISLLVGGVGIMNTMYTSVLERVREIGVMKAVGARNLDILLIFIIESGILGLVGGIIGASLGSFIAKSIEKIAIQQFGSALLKAHISPVLIFGSILFSFIVGALSGLAPAYQASKLKPVEALRFRI